MKIIIPMSGFGERFRRAGYKVPKPLIEIDGKPIISHVLDMFPGENKVIFICNNDHLNEPSYRMQDILYQTCPEAQIIGIEPHKLGPVHAVQQVKNLLDPRDQVIVNYCDFTCYWDWSDFKLFVSQTDCAGALPAYRGFHPHSLGDTNYAYIKERAGWACDIQEKQPFTSDKMQEYASSGTYYFRSAELMFSAFERQVSGGHDTSGEYYVSMAYKHLFDDGAPVAIYPLQHFMQWGTPNDVLEYNRWSQAFRALSKSVSRSSNPSGAVVVPMAGLGSRFAEDGYLIPKPLIEVSGAPMTVQAVNDMPPAIQYAFVLRDDMPGKDELSQVLSSTYPMAVITSVPQLTEGQAITAKLGLDALKAKVTALATPITFTVCDSGCIYELADFEAAIADPEVDILVWGVRGHPNARANPEQYGWLDVGEGGKVLGVSVKKPLTAPDKDPIVLGTFTFKSPCDFFKLIEKLVAREGRVNNEFYLDSIIYDALANGLNVKFFEVDHFLCWGVPNDLKTFEYWQSCFHKWASHQYNIEEDGRVPKHAVNNLKVRMGKIVPERPLAFNG